MSAPGHPAGWETIQRPSAPPNDCIDLYWCVLGGPASAESRPLSLLNAEERGRAQRMEPATAARFVRRRAALRQILGHCLGQPPQSLRFAYGPQGKPRLEGSEVSFSLAQRGDVVLLALGQGAALGVDLEQALPRADALAIAESYFSAADAAALRAQPPAARLAGFYRAWTRREAVVKADGRGVAMPLDSFDVLGANPLADSPWSQCSAGGAAWHWCDVPVGTGWHAALATSEARAVRGWRLAPDTLS